MHTIDAPVSQPMPRAKPTRPKTRTPESDRLFLLLGLGALDLGRATQSLLTVLALLALLSGCALGFDGEANTDQSVLRLELLHGLGGIVDEGKASGLATTELGAQAEDGDLILLGLVHAGDLLTELLLGDVGAAGVQNVNDHLLASQKRVADELASSQGDGGLGVSHVDDRARCLC
jgi:hypothetical protein